MTLFFSCKSHAVATHTHIHTQNATKSEMFVFVLTSAEKVKCRMKTRREKQPMEWCLCFAFPCCFSVVSFSRSLQRSMDFHICLSRFVSPWPCPHDFHVFFLDSRDRLVSLFSAYNWQYYFLRSFEPPQLFALTLND